MPAAAAPVEEEDEVPSAPYTFDQAFQRKIVALSMRDTTFATRTSGLIAPSYFEDSLDGSLVAVMADFFKTYRKAPDRASLPTVLRDAIAAKRFPRAFTSVDIAARVKEVLKMDISDRAFVEDKVSAFARHQAFEAALIKGADLHDKGEHDKALKLMQEAMSVGLIDDDDGYDYWSMIKSRTKVREDKIAGLLPVSGISTGYPDLDAEFYHRGFGRKEMTCFMGAAKAGKSMALGDFAKNSSIAGYNVAYFTLEVAAGIISARLDANISNILMNMIDSAPDIVEKRIDAMMAKAGRFDIFEYPTGTLKPSMMRARLERQRAKGIQYDLIAVDYPDLMAPDHRSDVGRENSAEIWMACRAIFQEENAAGVVATQGNREGAKSVTAKGTDVAEDFNKVRLCDAFITINATDDERRLGEARLFFSEMRNSESGFSLRIKQERQKMQFLTEVMGRE